MRIYHIRKNVVVDVSAADRARLEAIVTDRNSLQKHVWRARIVQLTADGLGTVEIMRRTGKSKTCVWRWQERFITTGVDGLLRDKTPPSRIPPLGSQVAERVIALTQSEPPGEATHWTGAAMAEAAGISISSVQRIRRAHGLQPHWVRHFVLLAQCCRRLLRQTDPAAAQTRRVPLDRRAAGLSLADSDPSVIWRPHGDLRIWPDRRLLP
jgi:transposase